MSTDQEHLLAICQMLDIQTLSEAKEAELDNNLHLIRSILNKLNAPQDSSSRRFPPIDQIPDSLAFPKEIRSRTAEQLKGALFWDQLKGFNDLLKQDYACRRQMLLNRLDCTIESFKWKAADLNRNSQTTKQHTTPQDKNANKLNDAIQEKYDQTRLGLRDQPQVTISDLLAVRENDCDRLLNSIVSSKSLDCQVAHYKQYSTKQLQQKGELGGLVNLKQIIIPDVPDRGGRTDEIRAPPKESYSQQHRNRGRGFKR